jgi:probable rRNA maturation factor
VSTGDALDVAVNTDSFDAVDAAELERAVRLTLASQGTEDGEVSLTLLDDVGIRALNLRYLGKDQPTDVIAFTLGPGPALLGDVYLGVEQARRQAVELGVPLAEELVRLAVHGTLHVLGHDHPEGPEREESPMFALQEVLVREIRGGAAGSAPAVRRDPRKPR